MLTKLTALAVTIGAFGLAPVAEAAPVKFVLSGDYAATWQLDDALPDYAADGQGLQYFQVMGSFPNAGSSGVDIDLFDAAVGGGFRLTDFDSGNILGASDGSQLYTGTATAARFRFGTFGFSGPGGDYTLSVSSAVPEPSTWALTIVGFGLVGAAMRRTGTTARHTALQS